MEKNKEASDNFKQSLSGDDTVGGTPIVGAEAATSGGLSEESATPFSDSSAPLPNGSALEGLKATEKTVTMDDLKKAGEIGEEASIDDTFNSLMANKSPEEVFAGMLYLYGPRLEMLVRRISNKGLRKLVKAVAEYPLNIKPYKLLDEKQKEAYNILDRMVMAKSMMMLSSMIKNIDEAKAASDSSSVNVSADPEGGSVTAQPVENTSELNNSEVAPVNIPVGVSNGEVQS